METLHSIFPFSEVLHSFSWKHTTDNFIFYLSDSKRAFKPISTENSLQTFCFVSKIRTSKRIIFNTPSDYSFSRKPATINHFNYSKNILRVNAKQWRGRRLKLKIINVDCCCFWASSLFWINCLGGKAEGSSQTGMRQKGRRTYQSNNFVLCARPNLDRVNICKGVRCYRTESHMLWSLEWLMEPIYLFEGSWRWRICKG